MFPTHTNNIQNPFHVDTHIIKHVVTSSTDAELTALYDNTKTLQQIEPYVQQLQNKVTTPHIATDNNPDHGLLHGKLTPKKTKCMNMRFHCLKDNIKTQNYQLQWEPGPTNLVDYFTKIHPPGHHKQKLPQYLLI